jgi:hypothetical protein
MILPDSTKQLAPWAFNIVDRCRVSVGQRAALARNLKQWRYTGSPDGNSAIINRLDHHVARKASYLFSPNDLRFHIDFTHTYGKDILDQAEIASRALTRQIERQDIDLEFGLGVDDALTYGASIPKLVHTASGVTCYLRMPWQMGVYREDQDFNRQEAYCETNYITPFDFWRLVSHLPNGADLFKRARQYSRSRAANDDETNFFHQVLIAGTSPVVQTDQPYTQQVGGVVQASNDPGGAILDPDVANELICLHELWIWDDLRQDFTTIRLAEPDILVSPQYRRMNEFVPTYHPYGFIQPNRRHGYTWGASELSQLIKLQWLLRDRVEDMKKLMGLQYDRLLAFVGQTGITDDLYDRFKQAGYMNLDSGSDVKDLTPKLPEAAFADVKEIMEFMDEVSGFQNILSGQGEPGVRAGNHAQTLMKTASPRLRDCALTVERQCADLGDKVFVCMAAKDPTAYWVGDGKQEGTEFLLDQLPSDRRITVDSHSSSPIYEEDHKDIAGFLAKIGAIDGEDAIEMLPGVPRKDILKERLRAASGRQSEANAGASRAAGEAVGAQGAPLIDGSPQLVPPPGEARADGPQRHVQHRRRLLVSPAVGDKPERVPLLLREPVERPHHLPRIGRGLGVPHARDVLGGAELDRAAADARAHPVDIGVMKERAEPAPELAVLVEVALGERAAERRLDEILGLRVGEAHPQRLRQEPWPIRRDGGGVGGH